MYTAHVYRFVKCWQCNARSCSDLAISCDHVSCKGVMSRGIRQREFMRQEEAKRLQTTGLESSNVISAGNGKLRFCTPLEVRRFAVVACSMSLVTVTSQQALWPAAALAVSEVHIGTCTLAHAAIVTRRDNSVSQESSQV